MNKRIKISIILISVIIIIPIITFILRDNKKQIGVKEPDIEFSDDKSTINEVIDPMPTDNLKYIENFKLAYEGRMDNEKAIIGKNAEQYITEPAMISDLLGGLVISYDDVLLFTNGYFDLDDNNRPVSGDVVMIAKHDAYGISSGKQMEEVEKLIGEPDSIIDFKDDPAENELFGINTVAYYKTGDYEVIIEYDVWGKTVKRIYLRGDKQNLGYPITEANNIDFLTLSSEELEVYNKFKEKYDEEELRGLEAINVMKLYIHAGKEKDYETEWELYTKEENQLGWDKQYHMQIPDRDRPKEYSHFQNPVNIEISYDKDYAVVTWEDKYLEEYDASGRAFRFGFSLVKSKAGIWKVAFLPMQ